MRLTEFYKNNPNPSASEIKKAASENWRVNLNNASAAEYVIALDNIDNVVGVYKLSKVFDTGIKSGNSTRKRFSIKDISKQELIKDFIGQNLKDLFLQGSQNPAIYKDLIIELV